MTSDRLRKLRKSIMLTLLSHSPVRVLIRWYNIGKQIYHYYIVYMFTCVSWHYGNPIEGPPETSQTSLHYDIEGFKGAFNWAVIMPRDVTLSDSRCNFSQSGGLGHWLLSSFIYYLLGNFSPKVTCIKYCCNAWSIFLQLFWQG